MIHVLTILLTTLLLTLGAAGDALTAGVNRVGLSEREWVMTELIFKGKEFVRNHHLTVPFRPLVPVPEKGIGPVDLAGNLIIHGDNLHALKALLPMYAGKVDVVFIDPPYNTGNEGWAYNDNVNSPMIKEWLNSNPIGLDDALRHDKWCALMYPRIKLIKELMSDRGSVWVTLDDNEYHNFRLLLAEVFGESNVLATVVWEKADSPKMDADHFRQVTTIWLVSQKIRKSPFFIGSKKTQMTLHLTTIKLTMRGASTILSHCGRWRAKRKRGKLGLTFSFR